MKKHGNYGKERTTEEVASLKELSLKGWDNIRKKRIETLGTIDLKDYEHLADQTEKVKAMKEKGYYNDEIANALGVRSWDVARLCSIHGFRLRRMKLYNHDDVSRIIQARGQVSYKEIAQELGCSAILVYKIVQRKKLQDAKEAKK